ncbi:helix-turn-helix transcriptional regulator [Bengtsoniella intestinalis]|uniref:helix-turn-helix domain-containing protein n=1 Tax=Bengtsoniella intestinalis TaxID=3073143 RepID=UPI00391F81E0
MLLYNRQEVMALKDTHYKLHIQIGLNIMRYRKEQGLTQMQLAELAGYSHNQIQRVETAYSAPTVGLLFDVAEALDISLEKLLQIR